jgi:hypothetical protein
MCVCNWSYRVHFVLLKCMFVLGARAFSKCVFAFGHNVCIL